MSDAFTKVLAIDTAMGGCSACVYLTASEEAFARSEDMPRGQAQELVPMINDVMAQAGISFDDLGAIVTTVGPGAFTGLRIGMSTARAMAQATGAPLFGVSTLQVLARQYVLTHEPEQNFAVLVETRREDFYVQEFDVTGAAVSEARAALAADIMAQVSARVFVGDAALRFKELAPEAEIIEGFNLPDPENIAQILIEQPAMVHENPEPIYLRGAEVSKSKKEYRTIA